MHLLIRTIFREILTQPCGAGRRGARFSVLCRDSSRHFFVGQATLPAADVGRPPWSAADAFVGLLFMTPPLAFEEPHESA
jgi:hypothetical protein